MSRLKTSPAFAGTVLLIGLSVSAYWLTRHDRSTALSKTQHTNRLPTYFFGVVLDENEDPVAQAEVVVLTARLANGYLNPGPTIEAGSEQRFSVWSDHRGRFAVSVSGGRQELQIIEIKKPGYRWVFDWAWQFRSSHEPNNDNREYRMAGDFPVLPYEPVSDRPAIFPMHREGSSGPATRPSRGGRERRRLDQPFVNNEPVDIELPSAGPGSPGDDPHQIERAIGEYLERRNAKQRAHANP